MRGGSGVDTVYPDFPKAFDTASYSLLLAKLVRYSLDKQSVQLVGNWLHQEGGGKQLLFKPATCHKRGPPGNDIGPNAAEYLHK